MLLKLAQKRIFQSCQMIMEDISWKKVAIVGAVGGTVAIVGAPVAISYLGFQTGGIAAGSLAAKMMSTAAIANSGGIASTSMVAALQSAGVLGLGAKTSLLIAGTAAGGTSLLTGVKKDKVCGEGVDDAKSQTVVDKGDQKSFVDGLSMKYVTDGASSLRRGASSIYGGVANWSSSLMSGSTGSDVTKQE